ncbi:PASTA domain-containing protein, partial [Actinoallomurus acaciae]
KGYGVGTTLPAPNSTTVSGYTDCKGNHFEPWTLSNAETSKRKSANLNSGTWDSINTFYAYLEQRVGLCQASKMAASFGMKQANGQPLQQVPSQVLGTNNIDVTHMAAAYAGFAARGQYCTPIAINDVTDATGKKINVPKAKCGKAVDTGVADEVTRILQGVITSGTGRGMSIGRPAAGKTGTCEAHSCALFAGYTPDLSAVVWYGDPAAPFGDPSPGVYGSNVGPIWRASMRGALQGTKASSFHTPVGDFGDLGQARVPNVRGLSVQEATKQIEAAGFTVQVSPRATDSDQRKGTVAYTSPSAGTKADQDTSVVIFVSNGNGPITTPHKRKRPGGGWPFH